MKKKKNEKNRRAKTLEKKNVYKYNAHETARLPLT